MQQMIKWSLMSCLGALCHQKYWMQSTTVLSSRVWNQQKQLFQAWDSARLKDQQNIQQPHNRFLLVRQLNTRIWALIIRTVKSNWDAMTCPITINSFLIYFSPCQLWSWVTCLKNLNICLSSPGLVTASLMLILAWWQDCCCTGYLASRRDTWSINACMALVSFKHTDRLLQCKVHIHWRLSGLQKQTVIDLQETMPNWHALHQ